MRIRSTSIALFAAMAATAGVITPAHAAGGVRITEVYFDSPGRDGGSNRSLNDEYVEIINNGSRARDLENWVVTDRKGAHAYRFGPVTLKAGATLRLHTGSGRDTTKNIYWDQDSYIWNNTGDRAILRKKSGTRVDRCTFTGAGSVASC